MLVEWSTTLSPYNCMRCRDRSCERQPGQVFLCHIWQPLIGTRASSLHGLVLINNLSRSFDKLVEKFRDCGNWVRISLGFRVVASSDFSALSSEHETPCFCHDRSEDGPSTYGR